MLTKDEIKLIRETILKDAGLLFTVLIENLNDRLIDSYWREFSDDVYKSQCLYATIPAISFFKKYLIEKLEKENKDGKQN